jgi:hypothetical protein
MMGSCRLVNDVNFGLTIGESFLSTSLYHGVIISTYVAIHQTIGSLARKLLVIQDLFKRLCSHESEFLQLLHLVKFQLSPEL